MIHHVHESNVTGPMGSMHGTAEQRSPKQWTSVFQTVMKIQGVYPSKVVVWDFSHQQNIIYQHLFDIYMLVFPAKKKNSWFLDMKRSSRLTRTASVRMVPKDLCCHKFIYAFGVLTVGIYINAFNGIELMSLSPYVTENQWEM